MSINIQRVYSLYNIISWYYQKEMNMVKLSTISEGVCVNVNLIKFKLNDIVGIKIVIRLGLLLDVCITYNKVLKFHRQMT